jgi:hypothetical protein
MKQFIAIGFILAIWLPVAFYGFKEIQGYPETKKIALLALWIGGILLTVILGII